MRTVVKTVELNLLPLTHVKERLLSETSEEYLSVANETLSIFKSENPKSPTKLHHLTYVHIKAKFKLQSQLIQDARRDVWAKRNHKNNRFKRIPITYNVPRSGSFKVSKRGNPIISVSTLNGRIGIPVKQDGAYERFNEFLEDDYGFTQFQLLKKNGNWVMHIPLKKEFEVYEGKNVLGVDIGVTTLATITIYDPVSNHVLRQLYFGRDVAQVKRDIGMRRSKLQSKQSSRARRALDKLREYETDFTKTRCYQIAHQIVYLAKEYDCTIAIEDLRHLNNSRLSRKSNRKVKRIPYHAFRTALESVAWQNGIDVKAVSPRHTSKTCSRCGKHGSRNGSTFKCECGLTVNADRNASVNIAKLLVERTQVSTPTSFVQNSASGNTVNYSVRPDAVSVECSQHVQSTPMESRLF